MLYSTTTWGAMAASLALLCIPTFVIAEEPFPPAESLPSHPELPDPLKMFDGTPVKTKEQWYKERRPELKRLFQHYMYGYSPAAPKITATVRKTDREILGGKATLKEIQISFGLKGPNAPKIDLALFVPNMGKGPFPVFLALNKCGNHTVLPEEAISIDEDAWRHDGCKKEGRGSDVDFWAVETLIDRGYAFATFHESNIDPDKHDFTDGVHPHYPDLAGPKSSHWGTIAAWAWGLQRCVDYLVTDPSVDKTRICVTGHSRRGKTALLAGAFDERIALVIPHQSGTGGCALSRNNNQETVERINRVFPHWFNDEFVKFDNKEDKLPIDQHLLMALVAPRALMDTEGKQDAWANFDSSLQALQAADVVYKFLGSEGIVGDGLIEDDEKITAANVGNLLQYRRDTPHTLNAGYWKAILDFADVYFSKTRPVD